MASSKTHHSPAEACECTGRQDSCVGSAHYSTRIGGEVQSRCRLTLRLTSDLSDLLPTTHVHACFRHESLRAQIPALKQSIVRPRTQLAWRTKQLHGGVKLPRVDDIMALSSKRHCILQDDRMYVQSGLVTPYGWATHGHRERSRRQSTVPCQSIGRSQAYCPQALTSAFWPKCGW